MPVDDAPTDRRFTFPGREPAEVLCRVCFEPVVLHPDDVMQTIADTYFKCPHCGRTFLVRSSDWWPG